MASRDPKLYDRLATKKLIKRYCIMALCLAPIIIILNFTLFVDMSSVLRIILDVAIILGLIFVIDGFLKSRAEKKEQNTKENLDGKQ